MILKKIFLVTVLAFFSLETEAQEKKFDFGFSIFPNYTVGIITNNGSTPSSIESSYKTNEIGKFSISSTIFSEFKLNEKSAFGLGLGYQNTGEKTKKLDLIFSVNPTTGNPVYNTDSPTQAQFVYNHHNVELAIYYKYTFGNRFYLLTGISGIFNVSNQTTSNLYYSDGRKEKETNKDNSTGFRSFNLSMNLGLGVDYLKRENFSLFVQLYAQCGILGVSKTAFLNRIPLSVGLSTGIRI